MSTRIKIYYECEWCNKLYYPLLSNIKRSKNHYCSYKCFQEKKTNNTLNHDYFSSIDNEKKAYWLGFLYADGNISKKERKQKSLCVQLSEKDKNHLYRFANIFNVKIRHYKRYCKGVLIKSVQCNITSKKIWNDLYKKGFYPAKTYKNTNKIFKYIPRKLMKSFILGFFDGDGGVCINKNTQQAGIKFVCKKSKFINTIRDKMVELSENNLIKVKLNYRKDVKYYVLAWSGINQLRKIFSLFYDGANLFLERKKQRFLDFFDMFYVNEKGKWKHKKTTGKWIKKNLEEA